MGIEVCDGVGPSQKHTETTWKQTKRKTARFDINKGPVTNARKVKLHVINVQVETLEAFSFVLI